MSINTKKVGEKTQAAMDEFFATCRQFPSTSDPRDMAEYRKAQARANAKIAAAMDECEEENK
jgi:hypothetical protein